MVLMQYGTPALGQRGSRQRTPNVAHVKQQDEKETEATAGHPAPADV